MFCNSKFLNNKKMFVDQMRLIDQIPQANIGELSKYQNYQIPNKNWKRNTSQISFVKIQVIYEAKTVIKLNNQAQKITK